MKFLRNLLCFLCVAGILCSVWGAFLWLERVVIREPVLELEYSGAVLKVRSGQEEHVFSLERAEQLAATVQQNWILLPRKLRLTLQGLSWLYVQQKENPPRIEVGLCIYCLIFIPVIFHLPPLKRLNTKPVRSSWSATIATQAP